jgi:hypothetical protein
MKKNGLVKEKKKEGQNVVFILKNPVKITDSKTIIAVRSDNRVGIIEEDNGQKHHGVISMREAICQAPEMARIIGAIL